MLKIATKDHSAPAVNDKVLTRLKTIPFKPLQLKKSVQSKNKARKKTYKI